MSSDNRWQLFRSCNKLDVERLTCAKCLDILVDPCQIDCGCRLCSRCINDVFCQNIKYCPGCKETISVDSCRILHDKAIEKEIFNLNIGCPFQNCLNICKFRDLAGHLRICEYRGEMCERCQTLFSHKEREKHEKETCKMLKIHCTDCGEEMTKLDFELIHRNSSGSVDLLCSKWRGICPTNCDEKVFADLKAHLGTCHNVKVECPMKEIGCPETMERRHVSTHLTTGTAYHATLMVKQFSNLKTEINSTKDFCSEIFEATTSKLNTIKEAVSLSYNEIESLKLRLENTEKKHLESKDLINTFTLQRPLISKESFGSNRWKIDNIFQKIDDAKNSNTRYLLSEYFYSGKPGYKISLKMYPNGDGAALGKYVSIYFVIMKGEYDEEVDWPFNRMITITLMTDDDNFQRRTVTMRPDCNDSCYGKPTNVCNVAAGVPTFVSHLELRHSREFLKSGSITVFANVS